MMAAAILVVGFMGMIQAVTIGSEMMATARRQTLANQIITHEIEQLRLKNWSTVINVLPTTPATLGAPWNVATVYGINDTVTSGGAWYRATQASTGQTPSSSSSYWTVDTPPYATVMGTDGSALGTTFTVTRMGSDLVSGNLREVTITVTWTKGGTTTAANAASGNWLEKLSFSGPGSISRTYTRTMTAYFGKYGLNLSQR